MIMDDVCVRYAFACVTYTQTKINDCLYAKLACISNYMLRSGCNNRPHKAKGETAIGVLLTATADAWQINQLSLSWSTRSEIRHCYTITTLLANGIYLHTNNNPIITVAFWIFSEKLLLYFMLYQGILIYTWLLESNLFYPIQMIYG